MKTQTLLIVGAVVIVGGYFLLRKPTITPPASRAPVPAQSTNPWNTLAGALGSAVGSALSSYNSASGEKAQSVAL